MLCMNDVFVWGFVLFVLVLALFVWGFVFLGSVWLFQWLEPVLSVSESVLSVLVTVLFALE